LRFFSSKNSFRLSQTTSIFSAVRICSLMVSPPVLFSVPCCRLLINNY
jgi:hypothetical protein